MADTDLSYIAAEPEVDCLFTGATAVDELLCFMQQKVDAMTADDIVKVCIDLFSR